MRPNAPGRDAPPPHNIRWSRRRRSGSPNATREILSQLHSLAPRHIGAAQLPVMRASEGRPISAETPFRGLAEFWRGPSPIVSVVLRSRVEDGLAGSLGGLSCYPHGLLASLVARASNDGLGGASAEISDARAPLLLPKPVLLVVRCEPTTASGDPPAQALRISIPAGESAGLPPTTANSTRGSQVRARLGCPHDAPTQLRFATAQACTTSANCGRPA